MTSARPPMAPGCGWIRWRAGRRSSAAVARLDPVRDLAVLTCDAALPAVAGPLTATDQMPLRDEGDGDRACVSMIPVTPYRFLTASGEWAGRTTRDDAVPPGG